MGRTTPEEITVKYLMLKHYTGGPGGSTFDCPPMDQWTPEEISDHIQFMRDFAARLEETGEFVDAQALAPEGTWVRHDGAGKPPVTDGPFAETKEWLGGLTIVDVPDLETAQKWGARIAEGCGWPQEVRPFKPRSVRG